MLSEDSSAEGNPCKKRRDRNLHQGKAGGRRGVGFKHELSALQ